MSDDSPNPILEELPAEAKELLRVARDGFDVPDAARARLRNALFAPPLPPGGTPQGSPPPASPVSPDKLAGPSSLSGLAKGKLGAALIGALLGSAATLGAQRAFQPALPAPGSVTVSSIVQPVPSASTPAPPMAGSQPTETPSAMASQPAAVGPLASSGASISELAKDRALQRERALIDGARTRRSQGARAGGDGPTVDSCAGIPARPTQGGARRAHGSRSRAAGPYEGRAGPSQSIQEGFPARVDEGLGRIRSDPGAP